MVWLEIVHHQQRGSDGCRDKDPMLDPERDWKLDMLGMMAIGGRNVVECEPGTAELELVLAPAIDWIVRTEP